MITTSNHLQIKTSDQVPKFEVVMISTANSSPYKKRKMKNFNYQKKTQNTKSTEPSSADLAAPVSSRCPQSKESTQRARISSTPPGKPQDARSRKKQKVALKSPHYSDAVRSHIQHWQEDNTPTVPYRQPSPQALSLFLSPSLSLSNHTMCIPLNLTQASCRWEHAGLPSHRIQKV